MGQTIGIPGAPYATPVSGGTTSTWTLCDTVSRAGTASASVETSLLVMPLGIDAAIDPIEPNEAMLADYHGQTWIVTSKGRHSIDLNDRALTSAVGIPITAQTVPISEGMFNALPARGPGNCHPSPPPESQTPSGFRKIW